MQRYYDEIAKLERNGFNIIVDKTWEDIDPRGQFEDSDIEEICDKINDGTYDWFMLRVRVMLDGHEFATEYLGGCLYEDAKDVMTDGTADDMIYTALTEAGTEILRLREKLMQIDVDTIAD